MWSMYTLSSYLTSSASNIKERIVRTFYSSSHTAFTFVVTRTVAYGILIVAVYFSETWWKVSKWIVVFWNAKKMDTLSFVRKRRKSPYWVVGTIASFYSSTIFTLHVISRAVWIFRPGPKTICCVFTWWIFLFTWFAFSKFACQSKISTFNLKKKSNIMNISWNSLIMIY